jgi:hypothetical protein
MSRTLRLVWLADLLGGLGYSGSCKGCGRQFLSRNVYVWYALGMGTYCARCKGGE